MVAPYVLVIMMMFPMAPAVTTAEFIGESRCLEAAAKLNSVDSSVHAFCFKKSEVGARE